MDQCSLFILYYICDANKMIIIFNDMFLFF